jgi:hypothetical protein
MRDLSFCGACHRIKYNGKANNEEGHNLLHHERG